MTVQTAPDFVEVAKSFAPKIEACREESERERSLPAALVEEMAETGMFRIWIPAALGGFEADIATNLRMIEEVARVDGAAGWNVMIAGTGGMFAGYIPESAGREIYGDPCVITAGAIAPKGRAVSADSGYRLSGQWPLASGCLHSTWMGGGSFIYDGDAPRTNPMGLPDVRFFFVPRDECEILDTWYSSGLRGTGSHDFAVKDVFVPEERTFSVMTAEPQYDAALYRAGILSVFPYSVAAVAVGIARGALDAFEDLAKGKVATFSFAALSDRPTVQDQLGRAEALYRSARAFLFEAADSVWQSINAGEPITPEQEAITHLACTNAGAACAQAVDMVYTLGGATSVYTTSRLQRCFRDVHVVTQHIGVSFQWYERSGRYFLGKGFSQFG